MVFDVAKYVSLWCPSCKISGDIFGAVTCPECRGLREPRARFGDLDRDIAAFLEYACSGSLGIDEGGMLAATWGERSPLGRYLRPRAAMLVVRRFLDAIIPPILGDLRELARIFQDSKAFTSTLSKAIASIERRQQDARAALEKIEKTLPPDPIMDIARRYEVAYQKQARQKREQEGKVVVRSELDLLLLERDELKAALAKVTSLKERHAAFKADLAMLPAASIPAAMERGAVEYTALFTALGQMLQHGGM